MSDRFASESFEDYKSRGKTVAEIDGQRLREREQQLVEMIADLESTMDSACDAEFPATKEVRSLLGVTLQVYQDELLQLRRQRAEWEERGT